MTEPTDPAAQILCEHRWTSDAPDTEGSHCAACGLGYREYVEGEVRAALTRMGGW